MTPDLVAMLRQARDPRRAQVFTGLSGGSRAKAQAPVNVDAIDACDEILTLLWSARIVAMGGTPHGAFRAAAYSSTASVHAIASELATDIGVALHEFAKRPEVLVLADGVIGMPRDGWSVAKAWRRWAKVQEPSRSAAACPKCSLRSVQITPPAFPGDLTTYRCGKCRWEADDEMDNGFWREVYESRERVAA